MIWIIEFFSITSGRNETISIEAETWQEAVDFFRYLYPGRLPIVGIRPK